MRPLLLAGFVAACMASDNVSPCEGPSPLGQTLVNDESLIAFYNSQPGATWVAGTNLFFDGMTFDDARPLLGTRLSDTSEHLDETMNASVYDAIENVSDDFDARTHWPGLIHPIRNQLQCGSCWAFSASAILSDRVAIATGKTSPELSVEDFLSCDQGDMGCYGGYVRSAWEYMTKTGLVTDTCFPYSAGGGFAPDCVTKCEDDEAFTKTKAKSSYRIQGDSNMQKDIMTYGPIQIAFAVFGSLYNYKAGVYHKHCWEIFSQGGHAVRVLGWGKEKKSPYWLVANSWGTAWGLKGFFKIKRGTDECGVETKGPPYAGLVDSHSSVIV